MTFKTQAAATASVVVNCKYREPFFQPFMFLYSDKPKIVNKEDLYAVKGKNETFKCTFEGIPAPTVTWDGVTVSCTLF